MKRVFAIAILISIVAIGFSFGADDVVMTEDGFKRVEAIGMVFEWKVCGTDLEFRLSAPGLGWLSVGFDPSNRMAGANYILAYVADGVGYFEDAYGTRAVGLASDASLGGTSDATLIDSPESSEGTMVHMSIPLWSGDAYDRPLAAGETYKVQFGYHDTVDDFVTRHTSRTEIELVL